jgi:IS30 family transposase
VFGGIRFYFFLPRSPRQRETNVNTNGLLREYLPKSFDMGCCSEKNAASFVAKLNLRPGKCLVWKFPFEVFFNTIVALDLTIQVYKNS